MVSVYDSKNSSGLQEQQNILDKGGRHADTKWGHCSDCSHLQNAVSIAMISITQQSVI